MLKLDCDNHLSHHRPPDLIWGREIGVAQPLLPAHQIGLAFFSFSDLRPYLHFHFSECPLHFLCRCSKMESPPNGSEYLLHLYLFRPISLSSWNATVTHHIIVLWIWSEEISVARHILIAWNKDILLYLVIRLRYDYLWAPKLACPCHITQEWWALMILCWADDQI